MEQETKGQIVGAWEGDYRVRQDEVGIRGEIQIPALFNFLQDAAMHHAAGLGVAVAALEEEGKAWVLRTMRVRIGLPPRWGEVVKVETWPSGIDGVLAFRDYQVTDSKGRIAVTADSSWLIIDRRRRRPMRLPPEWRQWRFPQRRSFEDRPKEDCEPEASGRSVSVQVGAGDIDFNGHVNHVRYIEWILDSLEIDFSSRYRLNEISITFTREAVPGDVLGVETAADLVSEASSRLTHRIVRSGGSDILTSAATGWDRL